MVDQNDLHRWIDQFGRGLPKGAIRELEKVFERNQKKGIDDDTE